MTPNAGALALQEATIRSGGATTGEKAIRNQYASSVAAGDSAASAGHPRRTKSRSDSTAANMNDAQSRMRNNAPSNFKLDERMEQTRKKKSRDLENYLYFQNVVLEEKNRLQQQKKKSSNAIASIENSKLEDGGLEGYNPQLLSTQPNSRQDGADQLCGVPGSSFQARSNGRYHAAGPKPGRQPSFHSENKKQSMERNACNSGKEADKRSIEGEPMTNNTRSLLESRGRHIRAAANSKPERADIILSGPEHEAHELSYGVRSFASTKKEDRPLNYVKYYQHGRGSFITSTAEMADDHKRPRAGDANPNALPTAHLAGRDQCFQSQDPYSSLIMLEQNPTPTTKFSVRNQGIKQVGGGFKRVGTQNVIVNGDAVYMTPSALKVADSLTDQANSVPYELNVSNVGDPRHYLSQQGAMTLA